MNIEETKKITLSLIETFYEAGRIALNLRKAGLGKAPMTVVIIRKISLNLS